MEQSHQTLYYLHQYNRDLTNISNMAKRCQLIAVYSFTYPFTFVYVEKKRKELQLSL